MKFGSSEVIDVSIFDKEGKLITILDSLKESEIVILENGLAYVRITDALFDTKLLKFIGEVEENNISDYENILKKGLQKTTIVFNQYNEKECKLICKTIVRQSNDLVDREVIYEIPNAIISNNIEFIKPEDMISDFDVIFKIFPFNDNNDLFKLHI